MRTHESVGVWEKEMKTTATLRQICREAMIAIGRPLLGQKARYDWWESLDLDGCDYNDHHAEIGLDTVRPQDLGLVLAVARALEVSMLSIEDFEALAMHGAGHNNRMSSLLPKEETDFLHACRQQVCEDDFQSILDMFRERGGKLPDADMCCEFAPYRRPTKFDFEGGSIQTTYCGEKIKE